MIAVIDAVPSVHGLCPAKEILPKQQQVPFLKLCHNLGTALACTSCFTRYWFIPILRDTSREDAWLRNFLKTTRDLSLLLELTCPALSYIQRRYQPHEHNRCFPQVCLHSSSSVPGQKRLSSCSCTECQCVLLGIASRLGILRNYF